VLRQTSRMYKWKTKNLPFHSWRDVLCFDWYDKISSWNL